jgi:itaconyl-CoA hydratase
MAVKEGWQGRFFEDFAVGDVYRSRQGRTVTEFDNIQFTLLTNNTNQIHFNNDYGARTEFGTTLVNSVLTLAIVTGLTVTDVSENGVNLGWEQVTMPRPVRPGDTLYAETEVLELRESRSRPGQGIVKVRTLGLNQRGEVVLELTRSVLVWKRDSAPANSVFPARE